MQLITKKLAKVLPRLGETDLEPNPVVRAKFFYPDFSWTWFAIEFDGEDTCYGYVDGDFPELGYFSLSELQGVRGPLGLGIERDRYFTPVPLKEIAPKLFEEDSQ